LRSPGFAIRTVSERTSPVAANATARRAPAGGKSDRADRGSGTLEIGRRRSSAPTPASPRRRAPVLAERGRADAAAPGGHLGNGTATRTDAPTAPVKVTLPAGVTAVSLSVDGNNNEDCVYAIGSDGHLYRWGDNYDGMLGDGTTSEVTTPEKIALPGGHRRRGVRRRRERR
jgi:Regulator of chromosome condensation (RCC1) repeat